MRRNIEGVIVILFVFIGYLLVNYINPSTFRAILCLVVGFVAGYIARFWG